MVVSRANPLVVERRRPSWGDHSDDTRELDAERWELIDAPWGSGSWLLAIGVDRCRAWVPPGVTLNGTPDEPVEWWRTTGWAGQPHDVLASPPQALERRDVQEVHRAVPADFRPWVVGTTKDQIRVLTRFIRRERSHSTTARDVSAVCAALTDQLAQTRHGDEPTGNPESSVQVPQSAARGAVTRWLEAFATLTDHDFALAVCDVMGHELKAPLRFADGGDPCAYVMECMSEGRRIVVQIRHDLRRAPTVAVRPIGLAAPCAGFQDLWSKADERWLVTSAPVHGDAARLEMDPVHLPVDSWVCDADQLTTIFDRHPAVVSRHLKLRVAREAPEHQDLVGLTRYAQTYQADLARHRLRDHGMVYLTGAPGSGKSALAQLLVAEAGVDGYAPSHVSNVEELEDALRTSEPQAILWDDFTPTTPALELISLARGLSWSKLIISTVKPVSGEHVVSLDAYSRRDRARILYNNLWAARQERQHLETTPIDACSYLCLLDDPGFSPRRVRQVARGAHEASHDCSGRAFGVETDEESHHLVARIKAGVPWCGASSP